MLETTLTAVKAIIMADPSVSFEMRGQIVDAIRQVGKSGGRKVAEVVVRRMDAAARLGISVKTLDLWRREGRLTPVSFGVGTRVVGFRESDLDAILNAGVRIKDA